MIIDDDDVDDDDDDDEPLQISNILTNPISGTAVPTLPLKYFAF